MDTRYISEFVSLAETLSYSRTAHALHLSQSSLSRHIQMMEKELGPLFVRSTRKIELSANGRIYLPWAKKITAAQQAAEAALKQSAKEHSAAITVGIAHRADLYLVTNSVMRFHHAGEDHFVLERRLQLVIRHLLEFGAGDDARMRRGDDADLLGDGLRGQAVVACNHEEVIEDRKSVV